MPDLITGGAGFIGSYLAERLVAQGRDVVLLDDLSTGDAANVAPLVARGAAELVVGSVLDRALVASLVARADRVFHLAASVGVRLVVARTVDMLVTNTVGTEHVLSAAAERGAPVLVASSSEVYGSSVEVPFREDASLSLGASARPRGAYACSKALDEFLAFAYARERGLSTVVPRFFNVIGARQRGDHGMVLPRFVQRALAGEPLVVHGDGRQTRCFVWAGDVADALPRLLDEPRARGLAVNLGSEHEVTIGELAERVVARVGGRARIELQPYEQAFDATFDDHLRRVPSLERARSLVGFRPTRTLDEIIDEVVEHERLRAAGG